MDEVVTNDVPFSLEPADDEAVRAYLSRLWARDWDSAEDSAAYDDSTVRERAVKLFGREPALWIAAIYAVLMTLTTFHVPGVDGITALLVQGLLLAAATTWTAWQVRPVAPAVFAGVVVELAALLAHFGLDLTETQVGSVQAALAVLVSLMVRGQVTPVADPSTQIVVGK